jgi:hypothetical protein
MITFAFLCLSARAAAQGFIAGCWETVPDAEPHVSEYSFGNAWPSALVRAWAIDKSNGQVAAEYNYTVTSHAYNGNGTTLRFNTSGFADTEWTFTTVTPASLVGSSASVYGTYPVSLMRPSTSPKQCKAVTPHHRKSADNHDNVNNNGQRHAGNNNFWRKHNNNNTITNNNFNNNDNGDGNDNNIDDDDDDDDDYDTSNRAKVVDAPLQQSHGRFGHEHW